MPPLRLHSLTALCLLSLWVTGCTHDQASRSDSQNDPASGQTGTSSATQGDRTAAGLSGSVYSDHGSPDDLFTPTGWLGDFEDTVETQPDCTDNPHQGDTCFKVSYDAQGEMGWAGLYWLYPDANWAEAQGRDLAGAARLTFWARGGKGGEVVTFKMGGIRGPKPDSAEAAALKLTLTPEWQPFALALDGSDLANVVGGFAFTVAQRDNAEGCTFYLDDIAYESSK